MFTLLMAVIKLEELKINNRNRMKLHLGCGTKWLEGYLHVDILEHEKIDIVSDLRKLSAIQDSSVEEIYACHVLEHFGRNEVRNVLIEWTRVLKRGGLLRISVPDFSAVTKMYQKTGNISELLGLLYGGQRNEYDFHKICFDLKSLEELLVSIGYQEIKRYDHKEFLPSSFDDYSRAYLPHMDSNGTLMSLNITARKI